MQCWTADTSLKHSAVLGYSWDQFFQNFVNILFVDNFVNISSFFSVSVSIKFFF